MILPLCLLFLSNLFWTLLCKLSLINLGDKDFLVKHGDRVAQAVVSPVISGRWSKIIKVDNISKSERGGGGFGSTGIS